MKTAVIYSGQARTVNLLHENHWWFVLRKLPNPTIFASVADDEQANHILSLKRPGVTFFIEKVVQPEIAVPPMKEHQFGYKPSASLQGVLKQLWAWNKAWDFVGKRADEFDLFVRIRSDLRFCRFEFPAHHSLLGKTALAVTPWWARWGGCNDRMALLGRRAAEAYFTTFSNRDKLFAMGCPLHPETMVHASLELAGISPHHTLATSFYTLRLDGTLAPETIQIEDVAEYARTKL